MWIVQLLLGVGAFAVVMVMIRRAARMEAGALAALKHAIALRNEMVLIQIDNEHLRREGVWWDAATARWVGRYTVVVSELSEPDAYRALTGELPALAARMWRDRQPKAAPVVPIRRH